MFLFHQGKTLKVTSHNGLRREQTTVQERTPTSTEEATGKLKKDRTGASVPRSSRIKFPSQCGFGVASCHLRILLLVVRCASGLVVSQLITFRFSKHRNPDFHFLLRCSCFLNAWLQLVCLLQHRREITFMNISGSA